jgi:hypothetical protein
MLGITADHNVEGHLKRLISICETSVWREVWSALRLELKPFSELGLVPRFAGSNHYRKQSTLKPSRSKFADADRILESRPYAELVVERLLEIILDIENLRGTGRLYVP